MKLNEKLGIKEELLNDLISIFKKYNNIEKVVVFGSRAQGSYKYNSDMDICIFGDESISNQLYKIQDEIDELYTPISFDILVYNKVGKQALKENIMNDGVEIYVR